MVAGGKRAGICAAAVALVAVAWLALPATPTGASGLIMVHGADSSSHLRLTTNGSDIIVNGYLAAGEPAGCHITHERSSAVCPIAGMSSMEIDMGPNSDKVEVLDPLPVPLTVYLGDGSDKFIGNSEPDTCYSQGTRRNRCYGGGGNDICITGPRNSDCVGDGGDDYCKHSTGSDGCWGDFSPQPDDPRQGAPGNDICIMGPGKDGCHGGPGNDKLYEGAGQGQLYGQAGFDYCDGGPGVGRSHTCEAGPGH
jgi:Ca2+-binding RTX toxin-like protein